MAALFCPAVRAAPCIAPRRHAVKQQRPVVALPQRQQRRPGLCGAQGNGAATVETQSSPVIGSPQQQHVIRMVNLAHKYFDVLLTQGDTGVLGEVLDASMSHKDMVRNVGRVGLAEYSAYLADLHRNYPDYHVKPTQFGIVDNRSMFVSFEGQVSAKSPKFFGVDLFIFNHDATRIKEVQVYRSNWLGAQGHEERKKQAEASVRAAAQRGQLP